MNSSKSNLECYGMLECTRYKKHGETSDKSISCIIHAVMLLKNTIFSTFQKKKKKCRERVNMSEYDPVTGYINMSEITPLSNKTFSIFSLYSRGMCTFSPPHKDSKVRGEVITFQRCKHFLHHRNMQLC